MPKEYIEREALLTQLNERLNYLREENGDYDHYTDGYEEAIDKVDDFPAADVVSRELFEQVKWERDIATAQLEEHGIAFGEKKTEVRRGEWVINSRFHRMIGEIEVREMLVKCPYCHRQYSAGFANGGRVDKQVIELARERYPYCHCGAKMDGERKNEGK